MSDKRGLIGRVWHDPVWSKVIAVGICWVATKILGQPLEALSNWLVSLNWSAGMSASIGWLAALLKAPIPLWIVVSVVVLVVLSRKTIGRFVKSLWSTNPDALAFHLACSGENPAHTTDHAIPVSASTRLRYSMRALERHQTYIFYFRFFADGVTPRWIGITNKPGVMYGTSNSDERSTSETRTARPDVTIKVLATIQERFPQTPAQGVVIDRLRLRGDSLNLKQVRAEVRIWS